MTIDISEIKRDILDHTVPLSAILRRAKVLAVELKSNEMQAWVENEMNGYSGSKAETPKYRLFYSPSFGDFSGYAGSGLKNAPIPSLTLPEKFRHWAEHHEERGGVKGIEALIGGSSKTKTLQILWPANNVAVYGRKIYSDMNCIVAWKTISTAELIQMLEMIRNKLLDFVLALEHKYPTALDKGIAQDSREAKQITQIFNNTFFGDPRGVVINPLAESSVSVADQTGVSNVNTSTGKEISRTEIKRGGVLGFLQWIWKWITNGSS